MKKIRCRTRHMLSLLVVASSAVAMLLTTPALAQNYTFNALYEFNGASGSSSSATLISDAQGNLYGTAKDGGASGYGDIFELVRNSGAYTEQVLYSFTGSSDGSYPMNSLAMDASGNLFGVALLGGANNDGTVFELVNNGGTYSFQLLYAFTGHSDGLYPDGSIALDADGDLFGAASAGGGANGAGTVFELVNSSGMFTFRLLYTFTGGSDGADPEAGVTLDANGNVYGTASSGGTSNNGTVFELVNDGGVYSEQTLYAFTGGSDGANPEAGVALDAHGNVYGTTIGNFSTNFGTVYKLVDASGTYTETTLHDFTSGSGDGTSPLGAVVLDANGDVFGTTEAGGGTLNDGVVYELPYYSSNGIYGAQILYSFTGEADGDQPEGGLLMDSSGDLFGTTKKGGSAGDGTVWELSTSPSATTSLSVTSSVNPIFQGESATLLATITPNPAGTSVAGTVTFSEGSTALGTVSVSDDAAVFTVPAALLGTGSDTITAQFTPASGSVQGSTGSVVETVNPASDLANLNGTNTFTGNQTVNGSVAASSFTGNGSGLTNVIAAALNCAACVGNAQLGVNYAASAVQGGPASNALLLGGLPPSSFATLDSNSFNGDQSVSGSLVATGNLSGVNGSFSGNVSAAGLSASPSGAATSAQAYNSGALDASASVFNSAAGAAQNMDFRWQAEPAAGSNNTASPAATLNLLYGTNGAPAETGLSVNANGTINFAAGQTFPGTSSGTITNVNAGAGLTGGGTSGSVTLSLANAGVSNAMLANPSFTLTTGTGLTGGGTISLGGAANIELAANACPAGSALTALPFDCSPFATTGANTLTGNQMVNGTVTAAAFVGNGAGLTNINAATATTAATATNALALGGQPASYYATAAGNTFQGTQTMPSVNVTGSTQTGTLTVGGGSPITEYVSVTDTITLPPIRPGECTTFETAPLAGFTPGNDDTLSLGIPRGLLTDLHGNPGPWPDPYRAMNHGPKIFLVYQAWETASSASTTVTLQVCNPSTDYRGGDSGTIRIDVLKH